MEAPISGLGVYGVEHAVSVCWQCHHDLDSIGSKRQAVAPSGIQELSECLADAVGLSDGRDVLDGWGVGGKIGGECHEISPVLINPPHGALEVGVLAGCLPQNVVCQPGGRVAGAALLH